MKLFIYIDRINLLDKLIRQKKTGTPLQLAERLNISLSRLARIIEYMRDINAPIEYDRSIMTYYYSREFSIQILVKIENIEYENLKHISGGYNGKKTFNAFFQHWSNLT